MGTTHLTDSWLLIGYSILAAIVLAVLDVKFGRRMQKKPEDSKPLKMSLKVVKSLGIVMLMVFVIITFAVAI